MNTKIVRLVTGEVLFVESIEEGNDGEVVLVNAFQPVAQDKMIPYMAQFIEVNELSDNLMPFKPSHIMHVLEAHPEIHRGFANMMAEKRGMQPIITPEGSGTIIT